MLEGMRLAHISFRSVNIFLGFTKLQVLALSENQIQDIVKRKALVSLNSLEIVNNPLAVTKVHSAIPRIAVRGVGCGKLAFRKAAFERPQIVHAG